MSRHSIGTITVRPHEPAMQLECERCGALLLQQLVRRFAPRAKLSQVFRLLDPANDRDIKGSGEDWQVLPCMKCPLDLTARAS